MRIVVRRFAVLMSCLAAIGCLPMRISGYRPAGPGILESTQCLGGIEDRLRIAAPHGIAIYLRATLDEPEQVVSLDVYLTVPAGTTARWSSDRLLVRQAEPPLTREIMITKITAPGPRELAPLAELAGSADESSASYSLWLTPAGAGTHARSGLAATPQFTVELPALTVEGERFEPGPITFQSYREWGVVTCVQ